MTDSIIAASWIAPCSGVMASWPACAPRGRGRGGRAVADDERRGHAGADVAGDRADQLVRARLEVADVQRRRRAGFDRPGREVRLPDSEVVGRRAAVVDGDRSAGADLRGRQLDRELGEMGIDGRCCRPTPLPPPSSRNASPMPTMLKIAAAAARAKTRIVQPSRDSR